MLRSVLLTLLLPPVQPASPQQPKSWGLGTASSGSGRSHREGRCLFEINSSISEFSAGNHSCTLHVKDTARDTRRYFSFLLFSKPPGCHQILQGPDWAGSAEQTASSKSCKLPFWNCIYSLFCKIPDTPSSGLFSL